MHGILDDFPSVKLLLCVLCAIVYFGFLRAVDFQSEQTAES
jgi:hypothetical protein